MNPQLSSDIQQVCVLGAGTVGASWAAFFLAQGLDVTVVEPHRSEAAVRAAIQEMWPALESLGLAPDADPDRLRFTSSIDNRLRHVQFIQENVPERLDVKHEILARLEKAVAPDAIIASSTSSLLATDIQMNAGHPERILVGHPFNPPHLIPLVEVVGGERTTAEAVEGAMAFYRAVGKVPVRVKKEAVGHIANRLTAAVFREAVHLVAAGIASVEDVDTVMSQGPGLRWALQGPFTTYHLAGGSGGIGHYMAHLGPTQEGRWRTLGNPTLTPELTEQIVADVQTMIGDRSVGQLAQERVRGLLGLHRLKER